MKRGLTLDAGDIRILRILQKDASLAVAEVAREAGMSQTPAWRRIKRLKEAGAIRAVWRSSTAMPSAWISSPMPS